MNIQQNILKQQIARLQKKIDKEKNIVNEVNFLNYLDQLERKELQSYKEPIENIIKKAENIIDVNGSLSYKTTNDSYNIIDLEDNSKAIINEIIEKYNENINYLQDNNDILQKNNEKLQKKIKMQKRKINKVKKKK